MEILNIAPTENSPMVILDPFSLNFVIEGESRPENVGKFYEPIIQWLKQFHSVLFWQKSKYEASAKIVFDFKMNYFNSTSAKYLLDILRLIDMCHADGCSVVINWHYDQRDEDMKESGEEFAELIDADFQFVAN